MKIKNIVIPDAHGFNYMRKGNLKNNKQKRNFYFVIIIFKIPFPIFALQKWSGMTVLFIYTQTQTPIPSFISHQ